MTENITILNELKDLGFNELIQLERNNPYTCPENYFDDLSQNILSKIRIQSFSSAMPYSVPEKYFENLPGILLDKLSLPVTNTSKKIYSLPQDYFNGLAENILQKVKEKNSFDEELATLSPLLSSIPKSNVYTVPQNYFAKQIFSRPEISQQPAKIISITGKRKWYAYASAACVAAIILLGGYFYNTSKNSPTEKQFANINVQKAISQLSDSSIDYYLQNDNAVFTNQNPDDQELNVQTLLENTSDEEIENYLIQNPDPEEQSQGI